MTKLTDSAVKANTSEYFNALLVKLLEAAEISVIARERSGTWIPNYEDRVKAIKKELSNVFENKAPK